MTPSDVAEGHRTHVALAVSSRVQILDALRASEQPMMAGELAAACGLHVSTVRFHLEVLGEAGLVRSRPDPSGRRGRPRRLYSPAGSGEAGPPARAGYELLASVMAANWADTAADRAQRAERAGHAAATRRGTPAGAGPRSMRESVDEVAGVFAELGFEPDVVPDGANLQIRLHACPFETVAATHPEVVCSLHLGLLRGALSDMGAPARASSLQPFVEPHLCIAHITPLPGQAGVPTATRKDGSR